MKSPAQEAIAQAMFWSGLASFPLFLALAIAGFRCRAFIRAYGAFCLSAVALNHFIWYFNVLGGALGTKIGRYDPPSWDSFLPYTLNACFLLSALWYVVQRRKNKVPQPPHLPEL